MIKSFASKETERIFSREWSKKIPPDIQRASLRKLEMLHAAAEIQDLRVPPGNRLEKLKSQSSMKKIPPIHPGEILLEEFIKPLGITQYRLALDTSVPPRRINEIVHGQRSISADTALRLARYFGTSAQFWLNLQSRYDLEVEKDEMGDELEMEVKIFRVPVEMAKTI